MVAIHGQKLLAADFISVALAIPGKHVKAVECLAPSQDMVAGAVTIRAKRLGPYRWEAQYTPLRWWQRRPKIELLDRPLHWLEAAVHFRWARETVILASEFYLTQRALGPDVRVIAFSVVDRGRDGHKQLNCYTRRVLYLRNNDPLEGVVNQPLNNCVTLNHRPAAQHNIDAVVMRHKRYLAELEARAKGWILHPHHGIWVPPEEYAAYLKQQELQRRPGHGY